MEIDSIGTACGLGSILGNPSVIGWASQGDSRWWIDLRVNECVCVCLLPTFLSDIWEAGKLLEYHLASQWKRMARVI